jgi:hypothetical protein
MTDEPIEHILAEVRATESERQRCLPLGYVSMLPTLTRVARQLGYTLAVHGSLTRDLDLIAVPWVEEAAPANDLAFALIKASGGFLVERPASETHAGVRDPMQKPHNRLAWSIHLGGGPYIDLSVMPRCKGCGSREAIP